MEQKYIQYIAKIEDEHWWYRGRRAVISSLKKKLDLSPDSKILEIGCGTGGNLEMLSSWGTINAVELDDHARITANLRNYCKVTYGKLPADIVIPDETKLICMLDVLEHVEDDIAALAKIKEDADSDCQILITVPAYKFLWSQHDKDAHHFRRYTKTELEKKLMEAGFNITFSSYFNSILFPVIFIIRAIKNKLQSIESGDLQMPCSILNRILLIIFSMESKVIPTFPLPFGVSIIAIAEINKAQET
ncbi:MAG TPA: class I SAM-dependent methyltransferase [Methylophilaceae bacterium]|nr:class I SAM-dependent methyltransferase [Methylophilaceae bacterium]